MADYGAIMREMELKSHKPQTRVKSDSQTDEERQDIIASYQDNKQGKISDPNETRFHEILNDEKLNIPYSGDMRRVKILADDISETEKKEESKITRDAVIEEPVLFWQLFDNKENKKAINNINDLLQEKNKKFNELSKDVKNFLTTYMKEKMNIIESYINDENDQDDKEGGKRKKHRRSRKKTSHKRKTKKHNKRKTKRRRKTKTKH